MDYKALLDTAILASIKGGREIMKVYLNDERGVRMKIDDTPVTEADIESNRAIESLLSPTGIPILSEESLHEDYDVRSRWRQLWLVDPLDGTKEFIKRNGQFTVNIALVEDGRPTIGVSFVPAAGILYCGFDDWSKKYQYAGWQDAADEDFMSLSAAVDLPVYNPIPPTVLVSSSHKSSATNSYIEQLRVIYPDLRVENVGSSLKMCLLAEGYANFYPRKGITMEWDTAAGEVILRNAGGTIVKMDDKSALGYNKPNLQNPDFIALSKDYSGLADEPILK